jgi:hypothetical protein
LSFFDVHEPYIQSVAELYWSVNEETTQEISSVQMDILRYLELNPKAVRKDIAMAISDITRQEDSTAHRVS